MTREEAYNRIDAIIAKYEIDDEYVTITNDKDYDALRIARKLVEQEQCDDAISRQAVLDIVNNPLNIRLDEIIKKLPPVNPQPKIGRWITVEHQRGIFRCSECYTEGYVDTYWKICSECGFTKKFFYNERHNYCPFCGCCMEDS